MQWRMMAAAAAVCLLAACGGGGSDAQEPGGSPPASPPAPSASAPTTSSANLSIVASGPSLAVAGGGSATFEVIVANAGPDAAGNVSASTVLGSGLTQGSMSCVATGGAVCPASPGSMSVTSLPANGSLHFQLTVLVAEGATGAISSAVSVSADNDATLNDNVSQVVVNAYPPTRTSSDIVVSGIASDPQVSSGSLATYAMTVANAGPDAATNVAIENVVDANQTLNSITCVPTGGASCPPSLGAAMTAPSIPVGSKLSFTVSALVSRTAIGSVSNTLYVPPTGDPVASNNVATATVATAIPTNSGSFVQLQSDLGDYIGQGGRYSYTKSNAVLSLTASGALLTLSITGNENWSAEFQVPSSQTQLQPGTYSNLNRYPFNNSTVGGLSWSGEGRGCNTLTGSFTIDSVSYVAGNLAAIDLRFEQHCEGTAPTLRGQIHWLSSDTTQPLGPVYPPPADLWKAAVGTTPTTGNYIYLQSDSGDYIGAGRTATYTQANTTLTMTASSGRLSVGVSGNDNWTGDFQAMNTLTQLQPGYYPGLQRYPFHNPALGGLSWYGNGRGCNTLKGWFVVDSVSYTGGALASIDLRFEQHCEGGANALRGQIHWISGDTTKPPGPQNPPPAGLWAPATGATPSSGNYVYLQSDSGDFIGQGQTYTYTPSTATVSVNASGTHATVTVNGGNGWTGDFVGMNSISQLAPGYYPGLQRYPFHNAALGGLDWYGDGRGCNTLKGWFVVDSVTYTNNVLASIDLRFEQICEGFMPPLHGKIHWIR